MLIETNSLSIIVVLISLVVLILGNRRNFVWAAITEKRPRRKRVR
jgi:hypothetical protein